MRQYRGGKEGLLGYFMGQVMARTRGKADPALAARMLKGRLGGDSGQEAAGDG